MQLSSFGGLLPLIKFLDLVEFRKIFDFTYKPPVRKPKLGNYSMTVGLLMLLFIGFNRICLDIDTTVETVFGNQQGARKGHNPRNRGKKGYRPVLCFIEQSREYLLGKLRRGETISGKQTAAFIAQIKKYLPDCVKQVLIRRKSICPQGF